MKGDCPMPTYFILMNYTDQGLTNITMSDSRFDVAKGTLKAFGMKIKEIYLTMGRYDLIAIVKAPDDEAVAKFVLSLSSQGNVSTETVRAFTEDEYRKIVNAVRPR
jgi:uncharacterized protein with GYD domain